MDLVGIVGGARGGSNERSVQQKARDSAAMVGWCARIRQRLPLESGASALAKKLVEVCVEENPYESTSRLRLLYGCRGNFLEE